MEILSSTDVYLFKAIILGGAAYVAKSLVSRCTRSNIPAPVLPLLTAAKGGNLPSLHPTRSILKQLQQNDKWCMIFYGSQTGTAERFAHQLSRELLTKHGVACITADMDDYDFDDLQKLSKKHLIIFILATYGDGEPTDNAIAFHSLLSSGAAPPNLEELQYAAFGLGSSSYANYNAMVRYVDTRLSDLGALRIGSVGMGDDGKGTLQESFCSWTDSTLPMIATHFDLPDIPYVYQPAFEVIERPPEESTARHVFLGEPNKAQLYKRLQGPYTSANPFPAPLTQSRELCATDDRSCLHMEFDVSGTSISYDTGDHLAVWPVNSNKQVELFLDMFNLTAKKDIIIDVQPRDPNNKAPIPGRSTYETVIRYYLDICAMVTQQHLRQLADVATSTRIRARLLELSQDKVQFASVVTSKQLTISQLLVRILGETSSLSAAIDGPFSLILELFPKLKPRHYSISSSNLVSRKLISITAVIDSKEDPVNGVSFRGVSTGYLAALTAAQKKPTDPYTHAIRSPRQSAAKTDPPLQALIHIRRSKFRPPFDPATPIIMFGPGTGVAPFRAFVRERAAQKAQGRTIGRTLLFYGCRSSSQDLLYQDEWQDLLENRKLGDGVFDMYTAFSREVGKPRQYVQDLLQVTQRAEEIRELVHRQGARVYVCGNAARMAKDVTVAMGEVLMGDGYGEGRGNKQGSQIIAELKQEGRWCEDVW